MRYVRRLVVAVLFLLLAIPPSASLAADEATSELVPTVTPGGTLPGDPSVQLVKVAGGLVDPVNIANVGDGSGRLFVVERIGRIRIVDPDGQLLEEPFLDIQDSVKTDFLEQGLLGLAFHPDYANNGLFYVYYANYSTNGTLRLVQYKVSADDPNKADPDSAQLLVEISDDPYVNHNGGTVRFGPDGYLYWTTGDGGLAGDTFENAQNIRNFFGKIFRIDVDTPGGQRPYSIPGDNPFAESSKVSLDPQDPAAYHPGAVPEIWAYGLRNPWQFDFDPETGDLYIADVGQNAWEEIDFQEAGSAGGQNYGWDWLEGSHCYPETVNECPRSQVGVLPVAEYDHSAGDCSITGLGVYRGDESPALDGIYFSSDFCSGRVWGLERDESGAWIYQELLDTQLLVAGGGSGEGGEVYLTSCGCDFGRKYDPFADPQGAVWRIVQSDKVPEGAETAPPEPAASPGASPAASAGATVDATVQEYEVHASPESAPAGEVTFKVTNNGPDDQHEFVVIRTDLAPDALPTKANGSVDEEGEGIEVVDEIPEFAAGATRRLTLDLPAGNYMLICNVVVKEGGQTESHYQEGMHTAFTVTG